MRGADKSLSRGLKGTVLEILGTAFSVGCQVDGRSPKDISDDVKAGSVDSRDTGRCQWALANDQQFPTNRNFDSDKADELSIIKDLMIPMSICQPSNDTSCSLQPIFPPSHSPAFSIHAAALEKTLSVSPHLCQHSGLCLPLFGLELTTWAYFGAKKIELLLTHYSPRYSASAVDTVVHIFKCLQIW